MDEKRSFVFYEDWYDLIEDSQDQEKLDFLLRIIKHGLGREEQEIPDDWNSFKRKALEKAFKDIDDNWDAYQRRLQQGESRGRRRSLTADKSDKLKELIAAGCTAKVCADELGVSESTINHDDIWRSRKENGFYR